VIERKERAKRESEKRERKERAKRESEKRERKERAKRESEKRERKERDWAQTNSYFIVVIDRHQMFVSHCKNRFIRVFERDAMCLTEE